MDIEETAAILNFYSERSQGGNGMNYFYTPYSMQRGTGVGSFLSGMVRPLIPIAKKGVMYLAPHLMKILRELAGDLIENPSNIKSSIKKHGLDTIEELSHDLFSKMRGGKLRMGNRRGIQHTASSIENIRRKAIKGKVSKEKLSVKRKSSTSKKKLEPIEYPFFK